MQMIISFWLVERQVMAHSWCGFVNTGAHRRLTIEENNLLAKILSHV
jgi:hypothetical protein